DVSVLTAVPRATTPAAPGTGHLKLNIATEGAQVWVDGAQLTDGAWRAPIPLRADVAHEIRGAKPLRGGATLTVQPRGGRAGRRQGQGQGWGRRRRDGGGEGGVVVEDERADDDVVAGAGLPRGQHAAVGQGAHRRQGHRQDDADRAALQDRAQAGQARRHLRGQRQEVQLRRGHQAGRGYAAHQAAGRFAAVGGGSVAFVVVFVVGGRR